MTDPDKSPGDRRSFLKTVGAVSTALTAGCTTSVGGWEVDVSKKSDQQRRQTTQTPRSTPTSTPTNTPAANGTSLGNVSVYVTPVEPYDPRQTPKPTIRYDLTELQVEANRVDDLASGGANDLELVGSLGLNTDAEVKSAWTGAAWVRPLSSALTLREGESQSLNMSVKPLTIIIYDLDYSEQKYLSFLGELWDRDGLEQEDEPDLLGRESQGHPIGEGAPAGDHSIVFSTGKSKVTVRYSISVS